VIRVDGVWKRYGAIDALRGVSLEVGRGEVVVLTGPSGAGKSTLLRLLYAAERPDEGTVLLDGTDLAALRPAQVPILRRAVGVVFQDCKLLGDRSARDNLAVALEIRRVPRREVRYRVDGALAAVGLLARGDVRADRLAGGEQQRLAVARAIVGQPQVLLADEPTARLRPRRRAARAVRAAARARHDGAARHARPGGHLLRALAVVAPGAHRGRRDRGADHRRGGDLLRS
jgi:cell division transport system ATP-binding protein